MLVLNCKSDTFSTASSAADFSVFPVETISHACCVAPLKSPVHVFTTSGSVDSPGASLILPCSNALADEELRSMTPAAARNISFNENLETIFISLPDRYPVQYLLVCSVSDIQQYFCLKFGLNYPPWTRPDHNSNPIQFLT